MEKQVRSSSDKNAGTPRGVSRGVNPQYVGLGLDTLYLIVEYPHADVYARWVSYVSDLSDVKLFDGIPVPERDVVLRRGAHGYKLSVWDGDARLYVTDRVEDRLRGTKAEGQGMGLMLQLGPKWLHRFGRAFAEKSLRQNVQDQLMWFGVELPEQYPKRINRLDIALDVLNLAVSRFSIPEWLAGWVGYAKPKDFHFDARSGRLTGFHIGSYKGNVSLKVYDKVVESTANGDSRFWRSVWDVGEDEDIQVARFEWTFRCYAGKFANLRYLDDFTFEKFLGLLNYAAWIWGSLRVPQEHDASKERWSLAEVWAHVVTFIADYSLNYAGLVRPEYHLTPDIKDSYLETLSGWLAGAQTRVGVEKKKKGPASLASTLSYLAQHGHPLEEIEEKAQKKWEVFSRLARGHDAGTE